MPDDLELLALEDVWTGAPPLASVVAAADYRVELEQPSPERDALRVAARDLLNSPTLERERQRGSGHVRYDLRPLLGDVDVEVPAGGLPALVVRTLFHVERGAGRPEEVVAALGERLRTALAVRSTTRLRVLLVDELGQVPAATEASVGRK